MDLYLFAGGHKINSWPFLLINNLFFFLMLKIKKNKSVLLDCIFILLDYPPIETFWFSILFIVNLRDDGFLKLCIDKATE